MAPSVIEVALYFILNDLRIPCRSKMRVVLAKSRKSSFSRIFRIWDLQDAPKVNPTEIKNDTVVFTI